jgi:MFS family permease
VAWLVAVSLTVTLFFQQRHQSVPLIPVHLFRRKLFSMGSGASFFTFLSGTAVFFIMPFYLQGVLGLSPTIAGFVIMPMAGAFALSGPLAGYVSDRFGWTRIELLGLGMAACSLIFLSFIDQKTSLPYLLPFLAMIGMGMGFFYSPNSSSVLSVIDPSDYGVGTAFLNLIRNSANIIGISMATMIITAMMAHYGFEASLDAVNDPNYGEGIKVAFVSGLSLTLRIQGLLILASVLLTVSKNINLKR